MTGEHLAIWFAHEDPLMRIRITGDVVDLHIRGADLWFGTEMHVEEFGVILTRMLEIRDERA